MFNPWEFRLNPSSDILRYLMRYFVNRQVHKQTCLQRRAITQLSLTSRELRCLIIWLRWRKTPATADKTQYKKYDTSIRQSEQTSTYFCSSWLPQLWKTCWTHYPQCNSPADSLKTAFLFEQLWVRPTKINWYVSKMSYTSGWILMKLQWMLIYIPFGGNTD